MHVPHWASFSEESFDFPKKTPSPAFSIMYAKWIQPNFMGEIGLILDPILPNMRGFHAANPENDAFKQKKRRPEGGVTAVLRSAWPTQSAQ